MEFTFENNIPIYIQLLDYMKIYLISGVFKTGEKNFRPLGNLQQHLKLIPIQCKKHYQNLRT